MASKADLMTIVSSKGQIVLPVSVRRTLGIAAGDALSLHIDGAAHDYVILLKRPALGDVEARLKQGYEWLEQHGRDPVAALHEARKRARARERQGRRARRRRRTRAA